MGINTHRSNMESQRSIHFTKHFSISSLLAAIALVTIASLFQSTTPTLQASPMAPEDTEDLHAVPKPEYITTTDTTGYPSSDPSGIAYLDSSELLIVDSEIEELDIFAGANLFTSNLQGTLISTGTVISISDEPTGAAQGPGKKIYLTDDNLANNDPHGKGIHMLEPGSDNMYGSPDDVHDFLDSTNFGSQDPEGVAYVEESGEKWLYVVDGSQNILYRIPLQADGAFDNDLSKITSIALAKNGITSIEGIAQDPVGNNLFIAGTPKKRLAEIKTDGSLVRLFNTQDATPEAPAGLTFGDSSDGGGTSIYIADRGVDGVNDGRIHEFRIPARNPSNNPPMVDAGSPFTIALPIDTADLAGVASDPDETPLTTKWTKMSGPGDVTFIDDNDFLTATIQITEEGTYVMRLTADDGELATVDIVTVTVTTNQAPTVNPIANPTTVEDTKSITLTGNVSDDGVPNNTLTYKWTVENQPSGGTVTFGDDTLEDTVATFSGVGTYELKLTATDGGGLNASGAVMVTVSGTNQPPAVNVDDDKTVSGAGGITLTGTVIDPDTDPGDITYLWKVTEGDTTAVTIATPNQPVTTVSISKPGTYTFEFTANDGEFTRADTVTITVEEATIYLPLIVKG